MTVPACREQLPHLAEAVHGFGCVAGWSEDTSLQIDLVLEEMLVNIMDYGYPEGVPGYIEIDLAVSREGIQITLIDDGVAFDPWQQSAPDLTVPIEDRLIGGLGLHLVKTIMDSYSYNYENGRNRTLLTKTL